MTKEQKADAYAAEKYYSILDAREQVLRAYLAGYAEGQKEAVKAIELEPELEGSMPDEMWAVLRSDKDAAENALRIVVKQTKEGILNRLLTPPPREGE